MKYHGPKEKENKNNYIQDYFIDEEEKQVTIIMGDGRQFSYPNTAETRALLSAHYGNQADTAIESISKYKIKRGVAKAVAGVVGVAGVAGGATLGNVGNADPMFVIAGIGTITLCAEALVYGLVTRPVTKKLEEAIHFKILKKHGPAVMKYVQTSDNAFAGFSEDRKQEILSMVDEGVDPISILEVDRGGLTTAEIRQLNENKRVEVQYQFKPSAPTYKR